MNMFNTSSSVTVRPLPTDPFEMRAYKRQLRSRIEKHETITYISGVKTRILTESEAIDTDYKDLLYMDECKAVIIGEDKPMLIGKWGPIRELDLDIV